MKEYLIIKKGTGKKMLKKNIKIKTKVQPPSREKASFPSNLKQQTRKNENTFKHLRQRFVSAVVLFVVCIKPAKFI